MTETQGPAHKKDMTRRRMVFAGGAAIAPTGSADAAGPGAAAARGPAAPTGPREIRMLGQVAGSAIPAESRQALVITGNSPDSSEATAVLCTRDDPTVGRQPAAGPWPAHNALYEWTDEHRVNDLPDPHRRLRADGRGRSARSAGHRAALCADPGLHGERRRVRRGVPGGVHSTTSSPSITTASPAPPRWTRSVRSARTGAAASGSMSTTVGRPRAASRFPRTGWRSCCASSTRQRFR
jgi:hypothetical protein